MRTLFIALFFALFSMPALAQTAPPPWPDIRFPLEMGQPVCPKIGPTLETNKRTWTSQGEQSDFNAASHMLQAKDYAAAKEGFAKFADQYAYSNYRDVALVFEMSAQTYLKDENGVIKVAEELVGMPEAEPIVRETGFVNLVTALSPHVRPDDPEKDRKLADLERWTQCGREALAARVLTPGIPQDAFEKSRQMSEGYLDRTDGFVAVMREQYDPAETKLGTAYRLLNSQDALTCLLLFETKSLSPNPDVNGGIFYLARWATLAPGVNASTNFLKQIYVIDHGSEKGLSDLLALAKTNTIPPPDFNILPPPKEKHHYGTAIVAMVVGGLLTYELLKHPDVARGIASSFNPSPPAKIMIFGGPDHQVYLGCLSCSDVAPDSIFNSVGPHGSRVSPESIWNSVQQYGSRVSPYSACNPLATDPPVIVDQEGTAYGRLTLNRVSPNIGAGARFYDWLSTVVCQR